MNYFDKANLTRFTKTVLECLKVHLHRCAWKSGRLDVNFRTVGLDAAKKGGNKQMLEIRGDLINVIKKPKRLLDAVRKPC